VSHKSFDAIDLAQEQARNCEKTAKNGFHIVQNDVSDRIVAALGCIGIAVYDSLCRFSNGRTGETIVSPEAIANRLGKTPKYIGSIISRLVRMGLVDVLVRDQQRIFRIRPAADISADGEYIGQRPTNRQAANISARNKEEQEENLKPSPLQGELVLQENCTAVTKPAQSERQDFSTRHTAARSLMPWIGLGPQHEPTILSAMDALMLRGWPDYHAACQEIYLRVKRYRSRDGPKETRYFLSDGIFLNPESTWGTHGPDTTQRRPRRISATEARRQRIDDSYDETLRILRERRAEAGRDCRRAPPSRSAGERGS
jgi:hypothetical protein